MVAVAAAVKQLTGMDRETDYIDDAGYRANVGIVIMNDERQVFIGGRVGARGWQFPQGGIRQGERPEDALYRELAEEVGLRHGQVEVVASTRDWLRYRLPPQFVRRKSLPLCIGQKQRWYLLRLGVEDSVLRFDSTEQPAEFDRWRWVDWWDPVRDVIYFKRDVYARALQELGAHAFPEGLPAYPAWWQERMSGARRERAPAGGPQSEWPHDREQHDTDQK
jgi:putative (di)nucleoside polyphosphate hydrolase